jgi:hypothetical protein
MKKFLSVVLSGTAALCLSTSLLAQEASLGGTEGVIRAIVDNGVANILNPGMDAAAAKGLRRCLGCTSMGQCANVGLNREDGIWACKACAGWMRLECKGAAVGS